jgi:translation initiation factor IF-3
LDETKQPLGVMPLGDALRLASSRGLDLIEIAPDATPPVCRIVNYGKFQYEESKRSKSSSSSTNKVKELQLTPSVDPHDFATKLRHAIEFLSEGMKVRVKLRFRGRQKAHKEFGFEVMNKFVAETAAYGKPDSPPKMAGDRDLGVFITPLPKDKRGKVTPIATATARLPELPPPHQPPPPTLESPAP